MTGASSQGMSNGSALGWLCDLAESPFARSASGTTSGRKDCVFTPKAYLSLPPHLPCEDSGDTMGLSVVAQSSALAFFFGA